MSVDDPDDNKRFASRVESALLCPYCGSVTTYWHRRTGRHVHPQLTLPLVYHTSISELKLWSLASSSPGAFRSYRFRFRNFKRRKSVAQVGDSWEKTGGFSELCRFVRDTQYVRTFLLMIESGYRVFLDDVLVYGCFRDRQQCSDSLFLEVLTAIARAPGARVSDRSLEYLLRAGLDSRHLAAATRLLVRCGVDLFCNGGDDEGADRQSRWDHALGIPAAMVYPLRNDRQGDCFAVLLESRKDWPLAQLSRMFRYLSSRMNKPNPRMDALLKAGDAAGYDLRANSGIS